MQCYYHGVDAVTTCNDCGKGLCKDCIITIGGQGSYSQDCFRKYVDEDKASYASLEKKFFIGKILGVIAFLFCFTGGIGIVLSLIIALWVACVPISISSIREGNRRTLFPGTMDDKIANFNDSIFYGILLAPIIGVMVFKCLRERKTIIDNNEALLARYENR